MGTRGFRVIKFRGRYWIFYNHGDSYPEDGLGDALVDSIPVEPGRYQRWLQSQRHLFGKWDSLLQNFLTIQPEDMRKLESGDTQMPVFHAAFDERLHDDAPPFYQSGFNDISIEWTYTIDLDREVFSVDNGAHFSLNHIPRNNKWIEALSIDNEGERYLLPQLVPAESVATLALDPPSFTPCTEYEALRTKIVKPKSFDHISTFNATGPRLRWMFFDLFQKMQQADLSVSLLGWQAQDLPFRELVFFILCLATGGEHLAVVDQRRIRKPYQESLYMGVMTSNMSEGHAELTTCLGVGYHMDGFPVGSAPKETKYWFEGALICLTPQLDHSGVLKMAIADAIEYGRTNSTKKCFNAVLISIEHLVLIKSFPDGSVEHTELLSLIPITTHHAKDPQARYSTEALDAFYNTILPKKDQEVEKPWESNFEHVNNDSDQEYSKYDRGDDEDKESQSDLQGSKEKLEEEHVEKSCVEMMVDNRNPVDLESVTEDEQEEAETDDGESKDKGKLIPATPVTVVSNKSSFLALIQLFEATTVGTLRPTQPNEARLPEEICEKVLRNVSDTKTYNSCLKVSRRFRLFCQQRLLVMDNIVFLEPLHKDPASSITKEKEKGRLDPQPLPDFLGVEVSSDRQMNVWFRSGYVRGDALTCFIVTGSEWNRKSFADHGVIFQGLCASLPEDEGAGKRKTHAALDKDKKLQRSEGTPWEHAIAECKVNPDAQTRRLAKFWIQATKDDVLSASVMVWLDMLVSEDADRGLGNDDGWLGIAPFQSLDKYGSDSEL